MCIKYPSTIAPVLKLCSPCKLSAGHYVLGKAVPKTSRPRIECPPPPRTIHPRLTRPLQSPMPTLCRGLRVPLCFSSEQSCAPDHKDLYINSKLMLLGILPNNSTAKTSSHRLRTDIKDILLSASSHRS